MATSSKNKRKKALGKEKRAAESCPFYFSPFHTKPKKALSFPFFPIPIIYYPTICAHDGPKDEEQIDEKT